LGGKKMQEILAFSLFYQSIQRSVTARYRQASRAMGSRFMSADIRMATTSDAGIIAAIYAPIVLQTITSFETVPPTPETMSARISKGLLTHPWLVAQHDGRVIGYAYASQHRERAAYRWSVDVSVYVAGEARRRGIGRVLYGRLFEILRAQNYRSAFAGIALPNEASVALHEAAGFQPIGIYREVGFKLAGWRDVGWWRLGLSTDSGKPAEPIPFSALAAPAP
jgi:phosphinothricin acetyltransferase